LLLWTLHTHTNTSQLRLLLLQTSRTTQHLTAACLTSTITLSLLLPSRDLWKNDNMSETSLLPLGAPAAVLDNPPVLLLPLFDGSVPGSSIMRSLTSAPPLPLRANQRSCSSKSNNSSN
jgi:hypothetical protein